MKTAKSKFKLQVRFSLLALVTVMVLISAGLFAAESDAPAKRSGDKAVVVGMEQSPKVSMTGLIAAAAAFGLGALGAGYAIANVGSAAMGAIAEKPEVAGQALIFVALAEGLVVFGFITAIMILGKV